MPRRLLPFLLLALCSATAQADTADLHDVYIMALENDPGIEAARQRVQVDRALADEALGALLPQASFNANWSDNNLNFAGDGDDETYDGERYSLQVRQVLFNWSAIASRRRAKEMVDQREAELADAMGQLLVDVSERYFNVLLAQRTEALVEAELTLVLQQVKQAQQMYERKLVRVTDLLETEARADRVRTDRIEAENQVDLALEELAMLTGEHVGEVARFRDDFTLPVLENTIDYWVELATENNNVLRGKNEAVFAAHYGIRESTGGHLPTANLVLSDQTADVGFDNLQANKRNSNYVGLDVTVPLYSGGATSARVRRAWAEFYIARAEEEATRREVLRQTRAAWLNTRSSRRRIDAVQAGVRSAAKSFEAMDRSFALGAVTAADVLEALHGRTLAERDYYEALYQYVINWLALRREAGIVGGADLQQLNRSLVAAP